MLSLSISPFALGASRSGGGTPAPTYEIYSDNTTNQGAVLTVSSGATLYRDGVSVTAPYTTTADDALATFWAADASDTPATRSASIPIDTLADAPPNVKSIKFRILCPNQSGLTAWPSGFNMDIAEFSVRNSVNTTPAGTYSYDLEGGNVTVSYGGGAGTIANLTDGNLASTYMRFRSNAADVHPCLIYTLTTPEPMHGGNWRCSAANAGYDNCIGDVEMLFEYESDPGVYHLVQTFSRGTTWSMSYGTLAPTHTIVNGDKSISGTFSYDTADITVSYTGVTGTGTVRIVDYSNTSYPLEIADWASVSDGGTVAATDYGKYKLLLNDSLTPGAVVISTAINVEGQAAPYAKIGMNLFFMQQGQGAQGDVPRNMSDCCDIYWQDIGGTYLQAATLNDDGDPVGSAPATGRYLVYHIKQGNVNSGRRGDCRMEVKDGSATSASLGTTSNISGTSISGTTVDFTIDASGSTELSVKFLDPVIPSTGFKTLCTKKSDGLTWPDDVLSPQAARDYEATQWGVRGFTLRDIHNSGVEQGANPATNFGAISSAKWYARASNQTGADIWHTVCWSTTSTNRQAWVQTFKDNVSSTALLYGEICNELWNGGYYAQENAVVAAAINADYVTGYTKTAATVTDGTARVSPSTGLALTAFTAGEEFWCKTVVGASTYQWAIVLCIADASIGDVVPGVSADDTPKFQVTLGSAASALGEAKYRWLVQTQATYGQEGKAIMGDRFISVLGWGENAYLSPPTLFGPLLAENNAYEHIDAYALNGYLAGGVTYASQAWMANHTTDLTQFEDDFFTYIDGLSATKVPEWAALATTLFQSQVDAGIPVNECLWPTMYEAGMFIPTSVPSDQQAGLRTALEACLQDSRYTTFCQTMMTALLTRFRLIVWHTDVQQVRAGSNIEIFGSKLGQPEITPPETNADYASNARGYLGLLAAAPAS